MKSSFEGDGLQCLLESSICEDAVEEVDAFLAIKPAP